MSKATKKKEKLLRSFASAPVFKGTDSERFLLLDAQAAKRKSQKDYYRGKK
jgi:hypothetical protein